MTKQDGNKSCTFLLAALPVRSSHIRCFYIPGYNNMSSETTANDFSHDNNSTM